MVTKQTRQPTGVSRSKAYSTAAGHAAQGACVLGDLYNLISYEADEQDQAGILSQAAGLIERWLGMERAEIGSPDDAHDDMGQPVAYVGKAGTWTEVKAEPLTTGQLDRWLKGDIPRRMLAIPFGGPIPAPGAPLGVDIDGEYFDASTDLYAGHKALMSTRERIVDWHHDSDPTGRMKGAILGRGIADEHPEADGLWIDLWANAGERRLALVAQLEERGTRLYGSSEAAPGWRVGKAGHIDVWPWIRQTISTSPQNTLAVMPPLKALLAADLPFGDVGLAAVKAALVGLGNATADAGSTLARGRLIPARASGKDDAEGATLLRQAIEENRVAIREILDALPHG